MNWKTFLLASVAVLFALQGVVLAQGEGRGYQLVNRLRLEYDDNIREAVKGEEDESVKVIEEIEFIGNISLEQTFLSLRYMPGFVYWADRDEDNEDIHHALDFILNHEFTPRLALGVKESLKIAELPELMDRGTVVRQQNDYTYNTVNGNLSIHLRPETRFDIAGRHILLRYDDDVVADQNDYDILVGGLTLRNQFVPETAVLAEFRAESMEYENTDVVDRGSDTVEIGLGLEQIFSASLLGSARAGFMEKDMETESGSESSPYGEASLTFLPSPATRISLGASFALMETDVYPFANQERTRFFASIAHDITARLSAYLSAGYSIGDYSEDDIATGAEEETTLLSTSGSEDITQVSARLTYQVTKSNWLETGWQYYDVDSELRGDYERNRIHLGWKVQL
ncbi:MAG: outer membrane beta-barrel protein [Kiritimatiellia bacterium]